jgi:hypothetical protein
MAFLVTCCELLRKAQHREQGNMRKAQYGEQKCLKLSTSLKKYGVF